MPQICCSFGVDVLEALAASCTQVAAQGWTRRASTHLACDVLVACALLMVHGVTLMSQVGRLQGVQWCHPRHDWSWPAALCSRLRCPSAIRIAALSTLLPPPTPPSPPPLPQAMVFGVAMNSQKNTLVALLIAANFTEIKGGRRSV